MVFRMYKTAGVLFFFFIISFQVQSQILPAEGSNLNYRLIGFSFPPLKEKVSNLRIELASGIYNTEDSFKQNICKIIYCEGNKVIGEAPFWGQGYTWRTIATSERVPNGHAVKTKGELHHFSIDSIPEIDTNNVRLRILQPAEKFQDAYVILEDNKVMYDMTGNPVWFLPAKVCGAAFPTNLSVSPQGTITLLSGGAAYEINYDGEVLWKAQSDKEISGNTKPGFHHDFIRLANGHYMVLGSETVPWRPATASLKNKKSQKTNRPQNSDTGKIVPKLTCGTVIEFDEKGKIIWYWKSSNYFLESDINYCNPSANPLDPHAGDIADTHANAFYFDEKEKNLYVGFKIINRIVKVKYPEGKVTSVYGPVYKSGVPQGDTLFCGQHSITKTKHGYLCIFDNHFCDTMTPSRIIIAKEPGNGKKDLEKIWEYTFTYDSTMPQKNIKGGNAIELADSSLFVCMGVSYSKLFIVNMDKKTLWSALPERWNKDEKKWHVIPQYRASIIENKKEMERLIWNREMPLLNLPASQRQYKKD